MENPLRVINTREEKIIDVREENRAYFWQRWVPRGKVITMSLLAVLAGGLIAFQLVARGRGKEVGEFLKAQMLLDSWVEKSELGALEKLLVVLSKSSILQKSYAAVMAQRLLSKKELSNSELFAKELFKKNEELFPHEVRLGKISLMIEGGELASALEESVLLKREIKESISASGAERHEAVYAYNLVRMGMLAKELGMREWEKEAWEELLSLGEDSSLGSELCKAIHKGNVDLFTYVNARMQVL